MTTFKQKQAQKIGIGVLVIGDLPEFSDLSLKSMANVGITRICFVADKNGSDWISRKSFELPTVLFCRHENLEINREVASLGDEGGYVEFGEKKFFLLMILKWLLILDMWQCHRNLEYSLFTDLDVAWRKNIELKDLRELKGEKVLAIQDDSRGKDRVFYCPGIMIWRKTPNSEKLIKNIYEYQRHEILLGQVLPDDKALNFYLNKESLHHLVTTLNRKKFVIGHRFPYLMAGVKGFRMRNVIAFHANYTKGSVVKKLYIKGALLNSKNPVRLLYFGRFIFLRISK